MSADTEDQLRTMKEVVADLLAAWYSGLSKTAQNSLGKADLKQLNNSLIALLASGIGDC